MTTPPSFDDLVGADVERAERERLRGVHELLVTAGPPPELPPHLEAGPTLAMTMPQRTGRPKRRIALLAAALCVLGAAFLLGYITGNDGGSLDSGRVIRLKGTQAAPTALAALRVLPADTSGNWPMRLTGTGLPKLTGKDYYEVFLVRNGKIWAPCGSFVAKGVDRGVDVTLNAPYSLRPSDTWRVTRQHTGAGAPGPVVLRPTNA
jgi:hypothetical protein